MGVDQQNGQNDDPDEQGEVDGLVRHGPGAKWSEQPYGCHQTQKADDVENHPNDNPDSLGFEVALQIKF